MEKFFFSVFAPFHAWLLKTFKGRVMGNMGGAPVLSLTVPGRKTGQPRTVPLLYIRDGNRYVVIASKGGYPTNPDWYANLMANGGGSIQVGEHVEQVTAKLVTGPERERLWQEAAKVYSGYNDYAKKTTREIPVITLTPRSAAA
jgi:deazaflavin-dependent oxidoreductase (nitroreductase family)